MGDGTVQDWFKAALLHDLGKTRGWITPEGEGHGDWSRTLYAVTPALEKIAERAAKHEKVVTPDSPLDEPALLALADRLQKGLLGWSPFETGEDLGDQDRRQRQHLLRTQSFLSFYGDSRTWDDNTRPGLEPRAGHELLTARLLNRLISVHRRAAGRWDERHRAMCEKGIKEVFAQRLTLEKVIAFCRAHLDGWDESKRADYEKAINEEFHKEPLLANLLTLQRKALNDYPHTTYIPHLALGVHQQITAALFFLLWRKKEREHLARADELRGFTLYAFTITPEPLAFFARLRYLNAYNETAETLGKHLYRELFASFGRQGLNELAPTANPFQFFHGSSFALLYDDEQPVRDALQSYLDAPDVLLDSISVQEHSYTLTEWGVNDGGFLYADANKIGRAIREFTLLPSRSLRFDAQSETRCVYCGRSTAVSEAELGRAKNLCDDCAKLESQEGVLNLQTFCADGYLGWVFLAFGVPLLDVAVEKAREINDNFAASHTISPGLLHPSETGFDEYFQALTDIQNFEAQCDKQIESLGRGARTLAKFAHLAIYLLCEDNYWTFLDFLNQERKHARLRIPTSLRAFLCRPKYPVWSLMERGAQYDPERRDLYYHIAQGSVTMFTDSDVNTIRNLGTLARSERVPPTQLNALVRTALQTTKAELFLEIDVRAQGNKIGQRFPGQLKNGLDALKAGDDFAGREKRAIFIKYVTKLRGEDRK